MKNEIREKMLKTRDLIKDVERLSDDIAFRLIALETIRSARTAFLYDAMRSEVRTDFLANSLLQMGKTVCYPRMVPGKKGVMRAHSVSSREELIPGPFQTLEPPPTAPIIPPDEIGVALVPGLAFTREGGRLGYGGGYYDRFLAKSPAIRVGICFFSQIVDLLPQEVYDMKMNMLVCETGLFLCGEEK